MGVFKMSTKIVSEMSNFIENNICEMSKTKMFNLMIRGALTRHNVKVKKVYTEKMKNKNNLLNYNMGFVVNQKISNDCLNEIQLLSNHFSSNIKIGRAHV